ncbi:MAG: hypothetical protein IK038_04965 [Bacteroidaceae bacterium]|nr:hypothetical protein [Bacteroidaceae bacterium]
MKKTILTLILMLGVSGAVQAIKPLLTEGFDKYNNSFKVDLVSVGYLSPQIVWEHYTNTRFSYGVSMQAHFMNRSNAVRANNEQGTLPTQVTLDGRVYPLSWSGHPLNWYADVTMDDGTHEVKWDRKYVGVMVCPEGRFYMGRKPDRGFYFVARADMGLFREQFIVSNTTLNKEYINGLTEEQKQTDETYQKYLEDVWHKANVEQGETFLAAGVGGGLGFQGWFKKNSHWGFDLNGFFKSDWKFSKDENTWEWVWGAGSPMDFNASIIYRF